MLRRILRCTKSKGTETDNDKDKKKLTKKQLGEGKRACTQAKSLVLGPLNGFIAVFRPHKTGVVYLLAVVKYTSLLLPMLLFSSTVR